MSDKKIVKTMCKMCPLLCGLDVHVEDGKIKEVTGQEGHFLNVLCPKIDGMKEWVYSQDRIKSPLIKINGNWQQVSWDEAFSVIVDKLNAIKQNYGARSLVFHLGNPFIWNHQEKVVRRFCDLYGTPNFTCGGSFCYYSRTMGHSLTFSHREVVARMSPRGCKCVIIWGGNPTESVHFLEAAISGLKREGTKLIVIDPRCTPLAKQADIYARIRPGTDCALALGLLNVIIAEGLYDRQFVEQWTVGFDRLVEHVKIYTPEKVEGITEVPADTVRNMARMYAAAKPAGISPGISLDHCTNGIQTSRAIAILIAITGNYHLGEGGNVPTLHMAPERDQANCRVEVNFSLDEAIGAEYPLFSYISGESTVVPIWDAILKERPYPVKGLVVQGSNPMLVWPNTSKTDEAFRKLEFLLVIDPFMTDTAKLADVVLPATTFLEKKMLQNYRSGVGLPLIAFGDKAIEPVGESMEDWKIWVELGRRMGYREYFPWEDAEEFFKYLQEPTGITLEQLKAKPRGIFYNKVEDRGYVKDGFETPSGKVEIYSEIMAKHGYDPLPTFCEPAETIISRPDLADKYPLTLITGARTRFYTHSQHRNVPALRRQMPEPLIEINTVTAEASGIRDGDVVKVESLRGSIELKARVTDDIHPKVVSIQHGWAEANANLLTDDEKRDPVSGYVGYKQVLCSVIKASK